MKRRTKLILGGIALLAVAGTATMLRANGGDKNAPRTVTVSHGTIVDKALAVGTIQPEVEVGVKSQISGVVRRRFAEEGDYVRAGAPLLEIKPNPTPLELADARRQVELRELELNNLRRDLERQTALIDQGLVSEQEYETLKQRVAQLEVQTQMAAERLALIEGGRITIADNRIETVIRSPITGFILQQMVEIGDPVVPISSFQEGTVLIRMAEMSNLVFRGTVDEIDVGRLKEGMPVEVKLGALPNAQVTGRLARISLKARTQDNATVFPVEIALEETDGVTLRAGYSANADVIIARRDSVLMIPERLITFEGDSATVTVLLPDGGTEVRTIKVGLSDAINVEVLEGLREGEKVAEKPTREIR